MQRRNFIGGLFAGVAAAVAAPLAKIAVAEEKARPSHEEMQRQMAKLQLINGRQISSQSSLKDLGLDFSEEQRILDEEEQRMAEIAKESIKAMNGCQPPTDGDFHILGEGVYETTLTGHYDYGTGGTFTMNGSNINISFPTESLATATTDMPTITTDTMVNGWSDPEFLGVSWIISDDTIS